MSRIDGLGDARLFSDAEGMTYTYEGAQDQMDRLQERIDKARGQISWQLDNRTRRGLERRIDAWELNHSTLFGQLNPIAQNDEDGGWHLLNSRIAEGELVPCRSLRCCNSLTKALAFDQAGMCGECWGIATTIHRAHERDTADADDSRTP